MRPPAMTRWCVYGSKRREANKDVIGRGFGGSAPEAGPRITLLSDERFEISI
jgi:hypothetical protein